MSKLGAIKVFRNRLSRYYLLNGVPWLIPGTVFLDTPLHAIYSHVGVTGGSFIVYLIATSIAILWEHRYKIFFGSLVLFIPIIEKNESTEFDLNVSIIQPSSDPFQTLRRPHRPSRRIPQKTREQSLPPTPSAQSQPEKSAQTLRKETRAQQQDRLPKNS